MVAQELPNKITLKFENMFKNFYCRKKFQLLSKWKNAAQGRRKKEKKNHIYHVSLGFSFLSAAFFHTGSN